MACWGLLRRKKERKEEEGVGRDGTRFVKTAVRGQVVLDKLMNLQSP